MLAPPSRARRPQRPIVTLLLLALPALALAQAPKPAGPAAPATATAQFKDLQVLPKDIAKADLKAIMKNISKALGTDCEHCHREPDMAADTDKKKVAREMMLMTTAINAKYPMTMKKVTCWTCHRGKAEPDKTPGAK